MIKQNTLQLHQCSSNIYQSKIIETEYASIAQKTFNDRSRSRLVTYTSITI